MSNPRRCSSLSRFTDPKKLSPMLAEIPDNPIAICEVAKQQTIHHNLQAYYGIPRSEWEQMRRIWPPRMDHILRTLSDLAPHNLHDPRQPTQRVIGACILESHFLAGMLRFRGIPARIRAGYFRKIHTNNQFVVKFWENLSRAKEEKHDLMLKDEQEWRQEINAFAIKQNADDHNIEHWICEYWDRDQEKWRLLDANNTFLKAHSDLDIPFQLPRQHFEYGFEAWKKMRSNDEFNPDQYAEYPQDGRSHIRSQMLQDFFSLLNHDAAAWDKPPTHLSRFVKQKRYEDLSSRELQELDELARLLSTNPSVAEIVAFYKGSTMVRFEIPKSVLYGFVGN